MQLLSVKIEKPEAVNFILGQTHFIKTVEDLHEALVGAVPGIKFGLAFCEASGPCLIRREGNDPALAACAVENARRVGAGHSFVIVMKNAFPINVLPRLRECVEVCTIFCATANPVQVLVAATAQGRGIAGVIDGSPPKGVETDDDAAMRRAFLRTIGYKY
jgi:hypothetical protein